MEGVEDITQVVFADGVPWYWVVDPDARTIDALKLVGDDWNAAGRLAGSMALRLPPLPDLLLDPAAIWR